MTLADTQKIYEDFLRRDYVCPIQCGNCCRGCPKLTAEGCSLERRFRPWQCNAYLCYEGYKALDSN